MGVTRGLGAAVAGMLLAGIFLTCPCAFALNPELDVSQYSHKSWTIGEGFFKGAVNSVAQTPDGYLWLGTDFGLLRFDGVKADPWQPPRDQPLPSNAMITLLAARDGTLWIGTNKGFASWKGNKLTRYAELAGLPVPTLLEDREGTIWAGGSGAPTGRLCAIQRVRVRCYGEDGSFGLGVYSLYEHSGNLWAGAATGLWRWKPDPPKLYPMPGPSRGISALLEGDNGALWLARFGGIRQLVDGKTEAYPLPAGGQFNPTRLLRDREGGLWIGTAGQGLLHVHQGRTDVFVQSDGLSGDHVRSLLEDREGNIWVGTTNGLDRFRDFAVPTISFKRGLSDAPVFSVLAARDGSVWLGSLDGLNRWKDGQITIYRKRGRVRTSAAQQPPAREIYDDGLPDNAIGSLFEDAHGRIWVSTIRGIAWFEDGRFTPLSSLPSRVVRSIAEDSAGNLWIVEQDYGLYHLVDGKVAERIPWAKLGHEDFASALVVDPMRGGLWLGFFQGGVAYFKDGQVRASYTAAGGLAEGQVNDLRLDPDGTLWAATESGLSRLKDGRAATLTSRNGLPCDAVYGVMEDDAQSFWLYMSCGLARVARSELDAWAAAVDQKRDPNRTIQAAVFDSSDGLRSHATAIGYSPQIARSSDGKLWFATDGGASVVDPRHLPSNKLPPPVEIERMIADRKTYDAAAGRRLPPLTRDLEIDYTGLSFVAPEKIRFRYKLEGHDRDWQDVGNRRQAFYSDLPPRNYRFRVMACNNSGVWNEAGASFDFSLAPAYYQTGWFRSSCVAAFFALLWALYRLRLHQVAREFNARLEERVGERTRIARELHDTLLQSFHGLIFRFQAAGNLLPARPVEAKQTLERALDDAAEAVTEARDAVHELRSSAAVTNDLAAAVTALGEELAAHQAASAANRDSTAFLVEVEGTPQELHPILRDEVYRIAGEGLRNAFRHARARRIEVEIRYGERELRVQVRDDGTGFDASALGHTGRAGHWGLPGMRERAQRIGGNMDLWSELGAGTEVELRIPASIAYQTYAGRSFRLFRKKTASA